MKITFFLEDKIKIGDSYTLYGDFANLKQAKEFHRYLNPESEVSDLDVPTGLTLTGVKSGKGLKRESYYDIDIFKEQVTFDTSTETYVIDYTKY